MSIRSLILLVSTSALFALGFTSARANWHHHSVSINDGQRRPAIDCSDLRIRFDDRDAVVRSEERTVTKPEAPVLEIQPHANGGVQVAGWDKDTYSVTACKAAAGAGDEAERTLSQITWSIEKGRISTKGPADEGEWTVYLLIRAPKSAAIDVETTNGPVSFYDVDGKLTAHAHNGPITLRNFSGDAEIRAENGPISLEGTSGNVRVHTENGPISVALKGKTWSGTGLSADAKNGPLTLRVPPDYESSFVVESTKYAPMSCKASLCDQAHRTWDDEHRRIEYGAAPALIHLSTVNGPVSVSN
ncbi:MAG TPA: hypothetical protein VH110_02150 [Candidatus Acidoferrum sp.]|nr:hypothetical protein [Candidatus Acidoferrum sp.]